MSGGSGSRSAGRAVASVSGIIVALLFVVVAALIFGGIFLLIPGTAHFVALLTIGFLSLLFSVVSYFAQALSRTPTVQRSAAWGFGAFGFVILFLSVGVVPFYYPGLLTTVTQFGLLIVLVLLLIVAIVMITWRARGHAQDERREASRQQWAHSSPPSAFAYAAARDPSASANPSDERPRGGA